MRRSFTPTVEDCSLESRLSLSTVAEPPTTVQWAPPRGLGPTLIAPDPAQPGGGSPVVEIPSPTGLVSVPVDWPDWPNVRPVVVVPLDGGPAFLIPVSTDPNVPIDPSDRPVALPPDWHPPLIPMLPSANPTEPSPLDDPVLVA